MYDSEIEQHKSERSMNGARLVGIRKLNLHSLENYVTALDMILEINTLKEYLYNEWVIPIVADWPEQLFIRKAITYYIKQ